MRLPLSATAWRWLLLTICLLSVLSLSYGFWNGWRQGDPGFTYPSGLVGAITVAPGSPAARAGLRTGDVIDLRALSSEARYRWLGVAVAGEQLQVPVVRAGSIHIVRIVAAPAPPPPLVLWFGFPGFLCLALFAAILAWRRPENREARMLALFLALDAGMFPLLNIRYTPWVRLDLVANAIGAFDIFADALLAAYAMLFPVRNPAQRLLAYTAYAIAGASAIVVLMYEAGYWFGLPWLVLPTIFANSTLPLECAVSLLCLIVTLAGLQGPERTRVAWVAASIGPYFVLEFVVWGLAAVTGNVNGPLRDALDVAIFLAPVGLWVSLLNKRLFDIGFALNRAAVFTGVSIIVVGMFVLAEWALSVWFSSASHTTNLAISAALALTLGLSVRAIHTRVDRVLDTLFFRKRHQDEQAIRMLAREAAYITDPNVLLSRVVAMLQEHADASSVQVVLDDGAGAYSGISENDPAIVRLQTTREPLDLRDVETEMPGEFAYPMLARGKLVGVLSLGLKRSGEAYAPDESDAIAQLAHDAGSALDVLSMEREASQESVLGAIRERLDAIVDLLQRDGMHPEIVIRGEG